MSGKLSSTPKSCKVDQLLRFFEKYLCPLLFLTQYITYYKSTLEDFIRFVGKSTTNFAQISETHTMAFADHLRTLQISVSTHNRKIIRLRKIFTTLQEYREDDNPFAIKVILRKEREEQDIVVRRLAFTREQEEQIKQVLDDPKYKIINKPEIKVVFYIGMYTGQRLKDCVLLQWQNVDLQHKRIMVKQFKTGKDVSIPITSEAYYHRGNI